MRLDSTTVLGAKVWRYSRGGMSGLALALLALGPWGARRAAAQAGPSGTYPGEPYNGLQITYSISGVTVKTTNENQDWTRTLVFEGELGSGELRVSGTAHRIGGWPPPDISANLEISVKVGDDEEVYKKDLMQDETAPFDVAVPISPNATAAIFSLELVGIYSVGTRNVKLMGEFVRSSHQVPDPKAGAGGDEEATATPAPGGRRKPRPTPTPAPPPGPGVLSGTIMGCTRDAFGRASGPDQPVKDAAVIVGTLMNFNTGTAGVDEVRNAKGIVQQAVTGEDGTFSVTLPSGSFEVIVWKRHFVPQIDSNVAVPGRYDAHICDNIEAPATHESLSFLSADGTPLGEADALYERGRALASGAGGMEKDLAQAATIYLEAAEKGHIKAQLSLGNAYFSGKGVMEDHAEAAKWYRKAAEQGDPIAQFNLAVFLDSGDGVAQDTAQAMEWYRRAAEQGDSSAQFNLAMKYGKGEGGEKDDVEAAKWLDLASAQGHAKAQFVLARLYAKGTGVPKDMARARELAEASAQNGYDKAKSALEAGEFGPARP